MWYTNARLFTGGTFQPGSFQVEGGRFRQVCTGPCPDPSALDLGGATVIPGLVDLHTHGNSGADCSDGDPAGLERMGRYLARHGITSFAPTSMTLPQRQLEAALDAALALRRHRPRDCARVAGFHMEGPYLSYRRRGAQNSDYLAPPDPEAFAALQRRSEHLIRLVDVAAELPGAETFVRQASQLCTVSVAHTDADYAQSGRIFDAGASHLTHLFNAMPPIHHRSPGVIGAASERPWVTAELICDGHHVHPSAVRMAFRLFPRRICLISDALRCCGMPEGAYELAGLPVTLRDGVARLSDGTLAGSATHLFDCLRNAIAFGIPAEEAVFAATELPARVLGQEAEIGSIAPGRWADALVCEADWHLRAVMLEGEWVSD